MKRPMLYWVILFVLGEVLSDRIPTALFVVILLSYCIFVYRYGSSDIQPLRRKLLAVGALFLVLGLICEKYRQQKIAICELIDKERVSFRGTVISQQEKNDNRYRLKVSRINDKIIHTYIVIESNDNIYPGFEITGIGKVKEYMTSSNPGQFDQKSYELSKGNMMFVENVKVHSIRKPVLEIRRILYGLRKKLAYQFEMQLDAQDASLAKAMVLGDKSDIDQDIRALYQRNGIAHLIAISGLHIAMLGGAIYKVLRRLLGGFLQAFLVGAAFIVMYGILTGLSGATVRAIIMLIMSMTADVYGRKYDALNAIAVALLLMLTINPGQLYQVGFLLSFGAVIGIALVYPVLEKYIHVWFECNNTGRKDNKKKNNRVGAVESIIDGLIVSISVQLVINPILLYFFYEIPLYGIFLNIIVVPLMSVLLLTLIILAISGMLFGEFAILFSLITKIMSAIAGGIFDLYERLCRLTEIFPYHTICLGRPDGWWVIAYYVVLLLILIMMTGKKKRLLAVAVILWCMLFVVMKLPGHLMITLFDVGQGDGIYIRTPSNNILIDGGSSNKKNIGTYVLKCGLKYYGCNHLDYMIVTHSDADHYSGVLELIEDSEISVDNFVLPAITNPDEAYHQLEKAARAKGCRLCYMKVGDSLNTGKVLLQCLNPENTYYSDKNSGSIVLWLRYRSFDMLLTGDMDENTENRLLENNALITSIKKGNKMEILKVAHHGSATASSEIFLKKTDFDTAVISVGENNRYGHPAREVMERLQRWCDNIYLTKDSGAITIRTNGDKYYLSTYVKVRD